MSSTLTAWSNDENTSLQFQWPPLPSVFKSPFNLQVDRLMDAGSCSLDTAFEPACSLCCRKTHRRRWPWRVWSTSRWSDSESGPGHRSETGHSCTASPSCFARFSHSPPCSWRSWSLWGWAHFGAPGRTPPPSLAGPDWQRRCPRLWCCDGSRLPAFRCHDPLSCPWSTSSVWQFWCWRKSPPKGMSWRT